MYRIVGWLLFAALFAGLLGCQDRAAPVPTVATSGASSPPARPAFDEATGYLHKPSGIGFVYPEGWENLGVTNSGPITALGLRRHQPPIEVTLYWTKPDVPIDARTVGDVEYKGLLSTFGEKLAKPEPIRTGDQPGFRLAISGGPLGQADPNLFGVIYVFAVRREGQPWKIKLRATAEGKEHLVAAEELIRNYRW